MRRMLLILVLVLPPCASAEINNSIFDVLNVEFFSGTLDTGEECFDGCNRSWNEIDDYTGVGNIEGCVISPVHISASIDITGYNGVASFDGLECISGCPADLAIIKQHVSTGYAGFEANKDWVKRTITITSHDGNTTATMRVSFLWHWTTYSSITGTLRKHYMIEHKTVSVTKPHPTVITPNEIKATAIITFYNNSRSPVAFIDMGTPESVIKTIYAYNNTSIIKYNKVGWPRDDHVEFTNTTIWDITRNQSVVTRRGESVVIKDRDFNISLLNITVETPYARHSIDDFRLTIVEPQKTHPLLLVKILAVIGISVMGTIMMVGVLRRSF